MKTSKFISFIASLSKKGYSNYAVRLAGEINQALIDGPSVQIDPSLQAEIQDAVNELRKSDPNFFKGISKIVGFTGSAFGEVRSNDPTIININLPKIKQEIKQQLGTSYNSTNPEHQKAFKEALKRAVVETISHEKGHVDDFDPETGKFPGGEGAAEQNEKSIRQKLHHDKPINVLSSDVINKMRKFSTLVQKVNKNTGKKEWALVSKKDHDKVLQWYGLRKPSDEKIKETEQRVQYFKHKEAQVGIEPGSTPVGPSYNLTGNDYMAGGANAIPKETRQQATFRCDHIWDKGGEKCLKCGDKDWMT